MTLTPEWKGFPEKNALAFLDIVVSDEEKRFRNIDTCVQSTRAATSCILKSHDGEERKN
jgi:hypothetical protein